MLTFLTIAEQVFAQALVAFRQAEGFSLTDEQYDSLTDQIALACHEFNPQFDYERFKDVCLERIPS